MTTDIIIYSAESPAVAIVADALIGLYAMSMISNYGENMILFSQCDDDLREVNIWYVVSSLFPG